MPHGYVTSSSTQHARDNRNAPRWRSRCALLLMGNAPLTMAAGAATPELQPNFGRKLRAALDHTGLVGMLRYRPCAALLLSPPGKHPRNHGNLDHNGAFTTSAGSPGLASSASPAPSCPPPKNKPRSSDKVFHSASLTATPPTEGNLSANNGNSQSLSKGVSPLKHQPDTSTRTMWLHPRKSLPRLLLTNSRTTLNATFSSRENRATKGLCLRKTGHV